MNQHHDIAAGNNPREQALVNLHRLTVQGCRFPNKVFLRDWAGYYFFDSDHLFDGEFVETAKALIKCEASICICVSDLEAVIGVEARV